MNPTLQDIADATNLSVASVSLVLNNRPNRLSEESRSKIINTAKKMGYVPAKRNKKSADSQLLGLIVPSFSNSFFAEIIQGASRCARENGWHLLIETNDDDPDKDKDNIAFFETQKISGLLIISAANCEQAMFQTVKFPVVQVDRQSPTLTCSAVILNHKKGGYLATRHLLELGHTRIACITGPQKHESARRRMEGYLWAFQEAGIPVPKDAIFEGNYQSDGGYIATDKIISGGFTAVFSGNDQMAMGLYKRLHELKKRVPNDISVVGYDDILYSDLLGVPLTTIHQSGYDLGYAACQRLLIEMDNPNIPKQTIYFEPELVIRESTADHKH